MWRWGFARSISSAQGTFRCQSCLEGGLCEPCRAFAVSPPSTEAVCTFGRRAGARVTDFLVGQLLAFATYVGSFLATTLGAVVSVWLSGTTPGKALLGMRVLSVSGRRVGLKGSLIRECAYFIDALFFGLVGKSAMDSSPLQQRHGDAWAETVVVRAESVHPSEKCSAMRLFLGLALGAMTHLLVLTAVWVAAAF